MHDITGKPVNNALLTQFDKQRTRGVQGFGLFDGQEGNMVRASKEESILKWLAKYDSNLLLFHHRFPTSTINVKRAAHPFSTKKYFGDTQYVLVHNGSIRNDLELFTDHQELGIEYYSLLQDLTFNDSEALLWDFALTMEGKQEEMTARGAIAFICLKLVKGKLEKMYFGRNSSPLKMTRTKEGVSLASELEGGEDITQDMLYTYNYKLNRLTTKKFKIPSYWIPTYKSDIKHGDYQSPYTKGSYADSNYEVVPSLYDCDCANVGWEQCNYHGYDWGVDEKWSWCDQLEKHEIKMGEKIGNTLSRKFGEKFGIVQRAPIEMEPDKQTQILLPVNPNAGTLEEQIKQQQQERRKRENEFVDRFSPISEEEVKTEYMAYLASSKGHFEQAYWALEVDYEAAMGKPTTKESVRERRVIELVMEMITNDPEYENEESVSNVWEAIWQN
jgi:hypothetical protein